MNRAGGLAIVGPLEALRLHADDAGARRRRDDTRADGAHPAPVVPRWDEPPRRAAVTPGEDTGRARRLGVSRRSARQGIAARLVARWSPDTLKSNPCVRRLSSASPS